MHAGGMIVPESVPWREHLDQALATGIDVGALYLGLVPVCR